MRTVRGMRIINAGCEKNSISKRKIATRMLTKAKALMAESVKPVKIIERMLNAKK